MAFPHTSSCCCPRRRNPSWCNLSRVRCPTNSTSSNSHQLEPPANQDSSAPLICAAGCCDGAPTTLRPAAAAAPPIYSRLVLLVSLSLLRWWWWWWCPSPTSELLLPAATIDSGKAYTPFNPPSLTPGPHRIESTSNTWAPPNSPPPSTLLSSPRARISSAVCCVRVCVSLSLVTTASDPKLLRRRWRRRGARVLEVGGGGGGGGDGDGGEGGVGGAGAGVQGGGRVGGGGGRLAGVQVRPLADGGRAHQGARPAAHPLRRRHRHRGRRILRHAGHQYGALFFFLKSRARRVCLSFSPLSISPCDVMWWCSNGLGVLGSLCLKGSRG